MDHAAGDHSQHCLPSWSQDGETLIRGWPANVRGERSISIPPATRAQPTNGVSLDCVLASILQHQGMGMQQFMPFRALRTAPRPPSAIDIPQWLGCIQSRSQPSWTISLPRGASGEFSAQRRKFPLRIRWNLDEPEVLPNSIPSIRYRNMHSGASTILRTKPGYVFSRDSTDSYRLIVKLLPGLAGGVGGSCTLSAAFPEAP